MANVVRMSQEQYQELRDDYGGICLNCGELAFGVEPDAESYECESCGQANVFGIEQALLMGRIELT